jgi:membrane protease subunit HflK
VIPRARGAAARVTQEAEGYKASVIAIAEGEASRFDQIRAEYEKAPEVTRDRLYIDAMQNVLGNTSKMVIDQTQGGNSVMYLPLDKMIENSRNTGSSTGQNNAGFTSSAAPGFSSANSQNNSTGTGSGRSANRGTSR